MKKGIKRMLAFLLTLAMCVSTTGVAAYAEETVVADKVTTENSWDGVTTVNNYTGENFNVVFSLANYWEGGYNASIKVENTGSIVIENWYLSFALDNRFSSIWNAEVVSSENSQYVVKNANWNADIPVGGCVEFGISVNETFAGFPEEYKLLGESTQVQEESYSVEYILDSDWGTGFTARMLLTNHTEEVLEDWTLEFDFDREITSIWNGVIEEHEGNHYVIKNAGHNANVVSGSAISFGFNGEGGTVEDVPENCELSSYAPGSIESEIDFEDMTDTDGDYLTDALESYYKTDKSYPDTDGDSLSDYIEIVILGTNPLTPETTEGVPDVTLDSDEDGLSNGEEIRLGLDPGDDDTDCDLVKDAEELKLGTDPLNYDTDGDGESDGWEVRNGTHPLVAEDSFNVVFYSEYENAVKASVEISLDGEQVETLAVDPIVGDNLFPEDMPGYIGVPYNFNVKGEFDTATIYFEFDSTQLPENAEPTIFYFNEEEQELEALETTINGNIASATVDHFSTYIVIDNVAYRNSFEWVEVWDEEGAYSSVELVLVIDDSGSMTSNDYSYKRLDVAKELVSKLSDESKIGVVRFASNTTLLTSKLTTDKGVVNSLLTTNYFKSSGGTYMYEAINRAFNLFSAPDDTTLRMLVVLSDGSTSDIDKHASTVATAVNKDIRVYTIGLGNSTSYFNNYLKPLAEKTDGTFYLASGASELVKIYEDIGRGIGIEIHSDKDGIPDYIEDHIVAFNGKKIEMNKYKEDTDGDELDDNDEVEVFFEYNEDRSKVCIKGKYKSFPNEVDSDMDGIDDLNDPERLIYTVTDRTLALVAGLGYSNLSDYYFQTIGEAMKNGAPFGYNRINADDLKYLNDAVIVHANDSGKTIEGDVGDRGLGSLALMFVRREKPSVVVYALRGTEPEDDLIHDGISDIILGAGWDTKQSKNAFSEYKGIFRNNQYHYYVTGHSLGGRIVQDVVYKINKANLNVNTNIPIPIHSVTFNSLGYIKYVYGTLKENVLNRYKNDLVNFYYEGDFIGDGFGVSAVYKRAGVQIKRSRIDIDEGVIAKDSWSNHGIVCWQNDKCLLYTYPHDFQYWID